MSERVDLQRMLTEIQEDEAADTRKAVHLSQIQIQQLIARRDEQATKPVLQPSAAR